MHTCNGNAVGITKTRCISKVFANLRLPHQQCARGKMNIAKDWSSSTHLQLRNELEFQKTCNSKYWKSNNYQTVSCSNYWNM